MLDACIVDVDGTLVDSNPSHVRAWVEALEALGFRVAPDRIADEIGKGGDQLVTDLLGRAAEAELGDALRRAHDEAFARIAAQTRLAPMPGAEALLAALRRDGLRTAIATSGNREGLGVIERSSRVAWSQLVDQVITGSDVERTKPAPDLMHVAAERLGLSVAQCALLGDTPWDAESASRAGITMIGVECGGSTEASLRAAGARLVLRDPEAMLASLDATLKACSPGTAHLDVSLLAELMRDALAEAERAMEDGEVPIAALLARGDGTVIARGRNRSVQTRNKARHAEIDAFEQAAGELPSDRSALLVSTLEPCVMCTGAAMEVAIDTVVYGLTAPADSGTRRVRPPTSTESQVPRIVGPILAARSRALFEAWLRRPGRDRSQEPYVRQLLASTPASAA